MAEPTYKKPLPRPNTRARAAKPRAVTVVAMSTPLMPFAEAADQIDYASTAFVILCASLVLLMTTPGLALFYGGMTRTKSILNMMMMSFSAMGVVGLIYVLYGYSMSFGSDNIRGIISNPFQHFGLSGTTDTVINPCRSPDGDLVRSRRPALRISR